MGFSNVAQKINMSLGLITGDRVQISCFPPDLVHLKSIKKARPIVARVLQLDGLLWKSKLSQTRNNT